MSHHGAGNFPAHLIQPLASDEALAKAMEPLEVEGLQSEMEALKRKLGEGRENLGATGEFPSGKLSPSDEGEFRYRVGSTAGKVLLDFGKPITWVGFDPEQADQLWRSIRDHTRLAIAQQKAGAV